MSTYTGPSRAGAAVLTPAELDALRDALLAERAEQQQRAEEQHAVFRELSDQANLDNVLEREIAERAFTRASEAVADIDLALGKIDDGTYGACGVCGGAIGFERLRAIPHTQQCVRCSGRPSR